MAFRRLPALAVAALRRSTPGYTVVELCMAMAVLTIAAAFVMPFTRSTLAAMNLGGDARAVYSAVSLAKMRAAAGFTRSRVNVQLASRTVNVERWRKDLNAWEAEGATVNLSSTVSFGLGGNTAPPPDTQSAIGQAPECLDAAANPITGSSCIEFNSRGVPIDPVTGAPYPGGAFYVTDGTLAYGVTVSAGGTIRLWRANAGSNTWSLY